MDPSTLMTLCEQTYAEAKIVAGPDGRDGATVTALPTGEVVLAFRGTLVGGGTSILDWLNDFHADLISADGCPGRVHAGFASSLGNLWPGVMEALKDADCVPGIRKSLWITGHSKGGAVAHLAGCWLASMSPQVMTFAAPRAGDLEFASLYPALKVTRYEGTNDVVPWLPPFGYKSVGLAIYQQNMPAVLRRIRIDELIARGDWKTIKAAHSLETGYRPWVVKA